MNRTELVTEILKLTDYKRSLNPKIHFGIQRLLDKYDANQHIGTLTKQESEILKIANNALYFADSSDYQTALWDIVKLLSNAEYPEDLEYIE